MATPPPPRRQAVGVYNGSLAYRGSGPFTVTGAVYMYNGSVDWIATAGTADVTIAADSAILGSGSLVTNLDNQSGPVALTNDGEIAAYFAGQSLTIATTTFTNDGVLHAGYGAAIVQTGSLTNLANNTLTGGSYIVDGPSSIQLTGSMSTLDATVALDGVGSTFETAGTSLEAGLTAIGSGGALYLGSGRVFATAETIALAGTLGLSGADFSAGGLSLAASGLVIGSGTIAAGAAIVDTGTIAALGGTLVIETAISGSGTLGIGSGATLKLDAASTPTISFGGGNATLEIASSQSGLVQGTIEGFAASDVIQIDGFNGSTATFAGHTLTVTGSDGTDTFDVAGSFAANAFQASTDVAGNTRVTLSAASALSLTAPTAVTTDDGLATAIAGLLVADTQAGTITLALVDSNGLLTVGTGSGATLAGNDSTDLQIIGTAAQVNAALATLDYQAASGVASDTLTVSARDAAGNSGAAAIAVTLAVPPLIAAPTVEEVSGSQTERLNGFSVGDGNVPANGTVTVALVVGAGTLSAAASTSVSVLGSGTGTLTLQGSVSDINAELASVGYGAIGTFAGDTLDLTLSDGIAAATTRAIKLVAVSDPLVFLPGNPLAVAGGTTPIDGLYVVQGVSESSLLPISVTLSDQGGLLTVSQLGGVVTGSGTNTVVINGIAATINADLATLTFSGGTAGSTAPVLDTLTVTATEYGATTVKTVAIANAATVSTSAAPSVVSDSSVAAALATNVAFTYVGSDGSSREAPSVLSGTYILPAPAIDVAAHEQIALGVYNSGTEAITVRVEVELNALDTGFSFNQADGAPVQIAPGSIGYIGTETGTGAGSTETLLIETTTAGGVALADRRVTILVASPPAAGAVADGNGPGGSTTSGGLGPDIGPPPPWTQAPFGLPTIPPTWFIPNTTPPTTPPPPVPPPPPTPPPTPPPPPPPPTTTPTTAAAAAIAAAGVAAGGAGPNSPIPPNPDNPLGPLIVAPPPPIIPGGSGNGDVHITTYDGLHYDFQAAGEFVLAQSTAAGDSFQVQIRLQPWYSGASVSVTTMRRSLSATIG